MCIRDRLVDPGVPVGGLHNGDAADDRLLAIAEGDAVFSEPVGKGSATAGEDVFGELGFEVEEQDLAGIDCGVAEGIGSGGGSEGGGIGELGEEG